MKKGLSVEAGFRLIVAETDDIMPEVLETLIPADVPRRYVDKQGPYYKMLVRLCAANIGSKARQDQIGPQLPVRRT